MLRNASGPAALALVLCAGCEPDWNPTKATPPTSLQHSERRDFLLATRDLDARLSLLREVPPGDDAADEVQPMLLLIAEAVANVPSARCIDAGEAADRIRTDASDLDAGDGLESAHVKRALLTAAGALRMLGRGPYQAWGDFRGVVQTAEGAIAALSEDNPLAEQRAVVLATVGRLGAALALLRDAPATRCA